MIGRMTPVPARAVRIGWASALAAALAATGPAGAAGDLLVYRCTDARGRVALRDSPCRNGETQQVRTMTRPVDPPPRARRPAAPPAASAPPRREGVYRTPPRPLYECVTPDGARYTSDTDAGNPRWMPLWTLGALVYGDGRHRHHGRVGAPTPRPPRGAVEPPRRHDPVYAYAAGTWVRDECHPLPLQEVCARLRDERYALDRRYHSALQGERDEITRRQRGIDARLAQDCGDP